MKPVFLLATVLFSMAFIPGKKRPVFYGVNEIESGLKSIPKGSGPLCPYDLDISVVYHAYIAFRETYTVDSFYMFHTEVSNGFYGQFMADVKGKGDTLAYQAVLPDTLVWRTRYAANEAYVEYYLRHPAYADYPVVGVSYAQCAQFCAWLTDKYNAYPRRKFKKVKFSLPTRAQWYHAAMGGNVYNSFPWGSPYLQNSRGERLANYLRVPEACIANSYDSVAQKHTYAVLPGVPLHTPGNLYDFSDVTAPVKSYYPNAYGLYNMAGNVEEYIREKGFTKGGGWNDTGFYLLNYVDEKYSSSNPVSPARGFRFVMEIVK